MLSVDDAGVDGAALGLEGAALGVDGDGAAARLSSATGVSGVEVAITAGLEDADNLGDLRLSPRDDESISSRRVTGLPRLFSSAAAVTTRCGDDLS